MRKEAVRRDLKACPGRARQFRRDGAPLEPPPPAWQEGSATEQTPGPIPAAPTRSRQAATLPKRPARPHSTSRLHRKPFREPSLIASQFYRLLDSWPPGGRRESGESRAAQPLAAPQPNGRRHWSEHGAALPNTKSGPAFAPVRSYPRPLRKTDTHQLHRERKPELLH